MHFLSSKPAENSPSGRLLSTQFQII